MNSAQPQPQPQPQGQSQGQSQSQARKVQKSFLATEQSEGVGGRVRRSIGTREAKNLSPFLLLDHFRVETDAGFPDHPHRGQETITYLLSGAVNHEDFAGNSGTIYPGDLQFMTAGRGIMHAEMPHPDYGTNVGFQLWVDLPAKLKTIEPRYRDLRAKEIPTVDADNGRVTVKVISGHSYGTDSVRDLAYTPVWLLDFTVRPGGTVHQELPQGWNAFVYVLEGGLEVGDDANTTFVGQYHNAILTQAGDHVDARVPDGASEPARFLLVAGLPLDQKVVQYGPFVMNSQQEVYQAMVDFQSAENGFERAAHWHSKIGQAKAH